MASYCLVFFFLSSVQWLAASSVKVHKVPPPTQDGKEMEMIQEVLNYLHNVITFIIEAAVKQSCDHQTC